MNMEIAQPGNSAYERSAFVVARTADKKILQVKFKDIKNAYAVYDTQCIRLAEF